MSRLLHLDKEQNKFNLPQTIPSIQRFTYDPYIKKEKQLENWFVFMPFKSKRVFYISASSNRNDGNKNMFFKCNIFPPCTVVECKQAFDI